VRAPASSAADEGQLPPLLPLVVAQAGFALRSFRRNPPAVFFSVLLPLIFLVLFSAIFGDARIDSRGIDLATYYVPAIAALAIVSTTFMNLAISVVVRRERGFLKRLRGTPLPPLAFVLGEVLAACALAVAIVATVIVFGAVFYGVAVPGLPLVTVAIGVVFGAAAFSAMGLALSTAIPNENSAPAIANAVALPLYFVSGLFFDTTQAPGWLRTIGEVLPLEHLFEMLLGPFEPGAHGVQLPLGHLAVVTAWGAVAVVVAARRFRWVPAR